MNGLNLQDRHHNRRFQSSSATPIGLCVLCLSSFSRSSYFPARHIPRIMPLDCGCIFPASFLQGADLHSTVSRSCDCHKSQVVLENWPQPRGWRGLVNSRYAVWLETVDSSGMQYARFDRWTVKINGTCGRVNGRPAFLRQPRTVVQHCRPKPWSP